MKYLVPIDGSELSKKSVKYVADKAAKYEGSEVILLFVIMFEPFLMYAPDTIRAEGKAKAEKVLAELQPMCEGVTVKSLVEEGSSAADVILNVAEQEGVDEIVMGSKGISNLKKFAMGSVSSRVAEHAECTVVLVR